MVCFVLTPRCFAYIHAATTFYQLQRGFGVRRQHVRIQEFLSVLFSPQLILQFTEGTEGSNGFIAEKIILILYQGSKGVHYFQVGCPTFSKGVQMLISIETHIRTCYFPGGGGPDPLSPSGSAHGQCHHNGTIFITVPLLTMIAGMLCQD